jgi:two-component system chemotaxis response regulator CheB
VCIGSSTGGPPVLETILTRLPASLGVPVVVAQHMPGIFTASMAERLNQMCNLPVVHVEQSMPLERGKVYIAPGGRQLHLTRTGTLTRQLLVNDLPADALYKPSVDILFASAAEAIGRRVLAIVLTGMGVDGLEGARALHQREAVILAQNEPTCVVYGMPKAVTENALVAASLDPQQIAAALTALARECPHIVRQDGTVAGSV